MKIRRRVLWCLLIVLAAIITQNIVFAATPEVTLTTSETAVDEDLSVVADGDSSFVFITPKNGPDKVISAAKTARNAIKSATGVNLEVRNDGKAAIATEILVGETNREESKTLMASTPYGEYAIRVMNGKIVIAAWDDESITKACEKFAAFVKKQGKKNTLTVAADYSADGVVTKGFGTIPHYGSTKNKVQLIDLADKSYMLYVPSTTKKDFSEYLNSLTEQGFTEFSHRTAGKYMTYATYCNEETILHISFNSSTSEARIASDKAYDMTIFTEQEYEKVCEPTVSLVGQEVEVSTGWIYNALCLVFRLEDGRFVIVDGGYAQFSINKLYKTLRSLHVNDGKITIAAWIFTHPHSDHQNGVFHEDNLTGGVLDTFEVGNVYHRGDLSNENAAHLDKVCRERGISVQVLERGMTLQMGHVSARVLWPKVGTWEKEITGTGNFNNQSIVIRFDYGEHSSLFTGDLYDDGEMALMSAGETELLDVDLLKAPHHGGYTSASELFLQVVSAELAVATGFVGIRDDVAKRYSATDTPLVNDLNYGYIHVTTDGTTMTYETSRQEPLPIGSAPID